MDLVYHGPSEQVRASQIVLAQFSDYVVALRLRCAALVGFPERGATDPIAYNSLAIVDAAGQLVDIYRKHHLYETDESWATAGSEFTIVSLPLLDPARRPIRICPCICMDLNPLGFTKHPFDAYELANHVLEAGNVDLVICAMNWLVSKHE